MSTFVLPELFNDSWVATAARVPMTESAGTLTFLEPVIIPATGFDEFDRIEMRVQTRSVTTQTYRTSVRQTTDDLGQGFAIRDLSHEQVVGLHQRLYNTYQQLGIAHRDRVLSRWQKWISGHWTSLDFPEWCPTPEDLVRRIRTLSNLIAARSRMGPANWIVVSPVLRIQLESHPAFVWRGGTEIRQPNLIEEVGSLGNLRVYVNTGESWSSTQLLMGRDTGVGNPGVYFCLLRNDLAELERLDGDRDIVITSRQALVPTSESARWCYWANTIILKPRPLWRRLLKL